MTEQGEVVNQSYGLRPIAMRTLERTFASVALATAHAGERPPIPAAHLAAMQTIAARSLAAYRELIFGSAQFFDILPRGHAARCDRAHAHRIAPGGARRGQRRARAARHSLGVRVDAKPPHAARLVRLRQRPVRGFRAARRGRVGEMVAHWPFFAHLLDDVEAMLGRTDLEIAGHYDALAGDALRVHAEAHPQGI